MPNQVGVYFAAARAARKSSDQNLSNLFFVPNTEKQYWEQIPNTHRKSVCVSLFFCFFTFHHVPTTNIIAFFYGFYGRDQHKVMHVEFQSSLLEHPHIKSSATSWLLEVTYLVSRVHVLTCLWVARS